MRERAARQSRCTARASEIARNVMSCRRKYAGDKLAEQEDGI